jgi:hypothetical protein
VADDLDRILDGIDWIKVCSREQPTATVTAVDDQGQESTYSNQIKAVIP